MKKIIIAFVILAVIAVCGCFGNGLVVQNAGGVIQDFSFNFGNVYDDDTVILRTEIQNIGGKEIEETNFYVYGQAIGDSDDEWQLLSAQPSISQDAPYIKDTLTDVEFMPPDSELGIAGDSYLYQFVLQPPNMPDGILEPANMQFYARLCFPYSTSTVTVVEITTKNELRATKVQGSVEETVNAAGPIQLELKSMKNVRSVSGNKMPLVFSVMDVGGGFSTLPDVECSVDTDVSDRNRVKVDVRIGGEDVDCGDGIVYMSKGEGTLYCNWDLDSDAPRTNIMVFATATYNYYVEKAASVQVQESSLD